MRACLGDEARGRVIRRHKATEMLETVTFRCRFIAEMVGAVGIEPTTSPV